MVKQTASTSKEQKLQALYYSVRAVVAAHYQLPIISVSLNNLNMQTSKLASEQAQVLQVLLAPLAYEEWCEQCHFELSEKEDTDCEKIFNNLAERNGTDPHSEYERAFQAVRKPIGDKKYTETLANRLMTRERKAHWV